MRVRGGALAGWFALSAVLGGCSGSRGSTTAPPTSTIAIATEPAVAATVVSSTVASTEVVPTTAVAAATMVLAPTSTLVPAVPVLVRVTPKTDAERELVEALKELLLVHHRVVLVQGVDGETVRLAYTGKAAADVLGDVDAARGQGRFGTPGDADRYVVDSIQRADSDTASAVVCFVNNAKSYVRSSTGDQLIDDSLVSRSFAIELLRTADGWRISSLLVTSRQTGVDSCGS